MQQNKEYLIGQTVRLMLKEQVNMIIQKNTIFPEEKPLISVCMLCYNHEKYVQQSIQSILNQSYSNWELIIVDNASTDFSQEIIKKLIKNNHRIKFYPLEINTFVSEGFNYAIKQCHGEYITILSADDYFEPTKIETQLSFIQKNNSSFCSTWIKTVDDFGNELLDCNVASWFNRDIDSQLDLINALFTQGNIICAPSVMLKKSIFDEMGYFDNRLLQTQDLDFWLRVLKKYPVAILNEKLCCYRVRDDGNNLSFSVNPGCQIRSANENIWLMQHLVDFDAAVISQVINIPCDNTNKYNALFNYFLRKNNKEYALAILLATYKKLGSDFEFPSPLYQDFLKMYGKFDIFNHFYLQNSVMQLFCDNGNGFSGGYLQQTVFPTQKIYEFDVSKINPIIGLRFDPINVPSKIKLNYSRIITDGNKEIDLEISDNNANSIDNGIMMFFHDDPIITFTLPQLHEEKIVKFIVDLNIVVISNHEVLQYKNKIQDGLRLEIIELENQHREQILLMENSLSWKLTIPLRAVAKKIPTRFRKVLLGGLKVIWWSLKGKLFFELKQRHKANMS